MEVFFKDFQGALVVVDVIIAGDGAVGVKVCAVPPDGGFDVWVIFDMVEHIGDPHGFVAADAGAGKFGDHQRLLILGRHLRVEGGVDLVEAAPGFALVVIAGVVAGEADDVDVFVAWIIVVDEVPAEIREGFFIWIPDPEGVFVGAFFLENAVDVAVELDIGAAVAGGPVGRVGAPVAVHFVERTEEHGMTKAGDVGGVVVEKFVVLAV